MTLLIVQPSNRVRQHGDGHSMGRMKDIEELYA